MEEERGMDRHIRRYFLEMAYHGVAYNGWQAQPNTVTVQGTLENCLSKLLRHPVELIASGRTDSGVHCRSQFAHFDVPFSLEQKDLLHRLNSFLPADISASSLKLVKPETHARFDAKKRTYEYYITLSKNPFLQGLAYYYYFESLSVKRMQEAAEMLKGNQDFKSFSKSKTNVKHFHCDVYQANWQQKGDLLIFTIQANRFLRGMVRLIIGALLEVGRGRMTAKAFNELLGAKQQRKKRFSAPSEGLYLTSVSYQPDIFLS